jgi:diacylglycerol kinase (ATP)
VHHHESADSHIQRRWTLILNPNAGSSENEMEIVRWAETLPQCDVQRVGETADLASLALTAVRAGSQGLIVAGGDGTVNAAINAVADHLDSIEIAIIPMGTGNDLARSLGIPLEISSAIESFAHGVSHSIDLVRMHCSNGTRILSNASAAGFSDAVGARADSEVKARWGPLAYIISAAAALPELTRHQVRFQIDDHRFEMNSFNIVIANGRFIAGGIPIAPEALLDDGMLDVIILPAHSIANAALAIPEILFGRHQESDRVITTRARRIRVESVPPMRFNADGEQACEGWAQYETMPHALRIIAAPNAPALSQSQTSSCANRG